MAERTYRNKKGNPDAEREDTSPSTNKNKRGKRRIIFLGAVVLLVLLVGVAFVALKLGFFTELMGFALETQKSEAVGKGPEFMYEVPEIVVNYSGSERIRFLSVKFYLGFDEPKLQQELDKRMPEIRDAVNKILWEKKAGDLNTLEGKEALREEIFETINGMLYSGELRGLYFWHLLIQ